MRATNAEAGSKLPLEALIAHNVNGIILFPADPQTLAPTVDKAIASGIPVVTLFSDVVGSKRLALVGGTERQAGRELAQRILDGIADFGREKVKAFVSFNRPGDTVTEERLAGIREVIDNSNKVTLLREPVHDEKDDRTAARVISERLDERNDVKVIFGLNARSAIGAIRALENRWTETGDRYQPGDMITTGRDGDDDVSDAIESEWIRATSVLYSSLCTQISFGILEAHNLGYSYPESLQLRELSFPATPREILIPETLVDNTTVEGYRRKNRTRPGPSRRLPTKEVRGFGARENLPTSAFQK